MSLQTPIAGQGEASPSSPIGPLVIELAPEVNAELSRLAADQQMSVMELVRRALRRERWFHDLRERNGRIVLETDEGRQKFVLL